MARGTVVINEDRCKGCGLCVSVCPVEILRLAEDRFNVKGHHPVEVTDPEACTGCAMCATICPDVVFTVYRRQRKSVRRAKDRPVRQADVVSPSNHQDEPERATAAP